MAIQTKQQIVDYTLELLEKKPINKITIRDIVSGCGITRNTFYYYFHDIYDVLDSTIDDTIRSLEAENTSESPDIAILNIISFMSKYRKVWANLLKTMGQEALSEYIMKRLHHIFLDNIKMQLGNRELSHTDMFIVCGFFEEALFGVLVRWVKGDVDTQSAEDIEHIVERIRVLFQGVMELLLKNGLANPDAQFES
ncbi:MAG: TetR/AcrR family transcriptional regulator [Lachnospiraceae bacterium]|nr:TetR/AcrR family transcriptional regulator [Candidatus Merdinaster equi]